MRLALAILIGLAMLAPAQAASARDARPRPVAPHPQTTTCLHWARPLPGPVRPNARPRPVAPHNPCLADALRPRRP